MVDFSKLSLYKGKRVLVTGDTGFKGSWLSMILLQLGAEIVGYALPPETEDSLFNSLGLSTKIKHIDGDIRDLDALLNVFNEHKPEFLFHLAAQAIVRRSYNDPKNTFDTNISGSVNILEAVRQTPSLKSIIYVTSDKCYKNKEWIWGYRENDELGGHDPYSASKAAAEIVFSSYLDSFFQKKDDIGLASVRAGNVIGGGDWSEDRIVPDCIRALSNNEPIIIRNPKSTRPWQHVLDPLFGYILLSFKLYRNRKDYNGSWNFGPDAESIKTVNELAEQIVKNWGAGKININKDKNSPHEAGLLHLNCDKVNQALNWLPKWDFERSIKETTVWYKDVLNGKSAFDITLKQIKEYTEGI